SYYIGVWWWWLRTPTTKEAITCDLEEMKAKKIQRLILADFGTGYDGLPYLELASPEWNEMVKHSILECKRLNLDFGICIGTSGAAAPWVIPEEGQQKLAFAQIQIEGPKQIKLTLPYPSDIKKGTEGDPLLYKDISVVAVPDKDAFPTDEIIDISKNISPSGELV
ncbi:hypothetical protein EZS27_034707, partial [termite gut metagenome]